MQNDRLIIGVMTGNSMDAVDVVMTRFGADKMEDVAGLSVPYSAEQKRRIDGLRQKVITQKISAEQLVHDDEFLRIHEEYVGGVAAAVNQLCEKYKIAKSQITAIGFHGKTLDHFPPSVAQKKGENPYTTQMGSAQRLADLTGIPVINDFRSALIQNGFEGAPLAAPHNARIAKIEGDGCYFNAGNTSNLAWVYKHQAQISWDAGPFNEYVDNFMLRYTGATMDLDGRYGKKGKLLPELLQKLFDYGRDYYEMQPPKSGDPAYYGTEKIFAEIEKTYGVPHRSTQLFCDILHTLEYFSGYLAAYAVAQTPERILMTPQFILFGGGWKNPLCSAGFQNVINGKGYVLPEHQNLFAALRKRLGECQIKYSAYGNFMEARLMADLADHFITGQTWPLPELQGKKMVLGKIRRPQEQKVDDYLSAAARGWQKN